MKRRIFILDDDDNACQLAERVLTKAGYDVQTQTRAIGATTAIRAYHPDLVLLDVMMPALSGDALAEILLRSVKPCPKILFYSNKQEDELRELARATSVDGYVCKVHGPAALLKTVRGIFTE
jgi:DNA-binding response OmpR family regulator